MIKFSLKDLIVRIKIIASLSYGYILTGNLISSNHVILIFLKHYLSNLKLFGLEKYRHLLGELY
ncbi:MAG: hypothetical protein K9G76_09080 [Bacteroidales bacterium]|nr:hypothetical protein [Bacteroidales bacterium]MCF8403703.1 hypothetical protein [Bacteroidales bacterium]